MDATDAEGEPAANRRRPTRRLLLAGAVVGGAAVMGGVALGVRLTAVDPIAAAAAAGRTSAPPWSAPSDVEAAARSAGLPIITGEGRAMHIHQHLSVTVDGTAVTVPARLGIEQATRRTSALHTHDASGILHVESPVVTTFHLDQAFAEWDVRLAKGAVGPWVDGRDGVRESVFVDGARYDGDPRDIVLTSHQDIDVVVTTDGSTPTAPPAFRWPAGYRAPSPTARAGQ